MSSTASASSTSSASASATASATATTTATPSTSFSVTPTSHAAEMNTGIVSGFFGGIATGSFILIGAALIFPGLIVAFSRFARSRTPDREPLLNGNNPNGSNGGPGSSPLRVNNGYSAVATTDENTVPLTKFTAAEARITELQTEVDTYKAMVFASANSTSLGTSSGSNTNVNASVWDRREFLQKCAEMTNIVATALDECIADAFATGKGTSALVVAGAMQRLWTLSANKSTSIFYKVKDQLLTVSLTTDANTNGGSVSNSQKESLAKSTLFNIYYRSVLETLFTDNNQWNNVCTDVINTWLDELMIHKICASSGVDTIRTDIGRCGLAKAIAIYCKLSVWPMVTNSTLIWSLENNHTSLSQNNVLSLSNNELKAVIKSLTYDSSIHQVFSLVGKSTNNGDTVYEIGPSLQTTVNATESSTADIDIISLRKTCRTLVVPTAK